VRLIQPQEDEAVIDDAPLDAERLQERRRCNGYVAHEASLFNDTVRATCFGLPGGNRR
jgi:ABC-type proline/glycine betaine transport system ATPase subunit